MKDDVNSNPHAAAADVYFQAREALRLDDAQRAIELCRRAIGLYGDGPDRDAVTTAPVFITLGKALVMLDRIPDALDAFDMACDLSESHATEAVKCLSERALFLLQAGHAAAAVGALDDLLANPAATDLGHDWLGTMYDHLAWALADAGDPVRAMEAYETAAALLRSAAPLDRIINLLGRAEVARRTDMPGAASRCFRSALWLARSAAELSPEEASRFRESCRRAVEMRFSDGDVEARYFAAVSMTTYGFMYSPYTSPLDELRDAYEQANATGDRWVALLALAKATEFVELEGDLAGAMNFARNGLSTARRVALAPFVAWFSSELAILRELAGLSESDDEGLMQLAEAQYYFELHERHQTELGVELTETFGLQSAVSIDPSVTLNSLAILARKYRDPEIARRLFTRAVQIQARLGVTIDVLTQANALLNLIDIRDHDPLNIEVVKDIEDNAAQLENRMASGGVPAGDHVAAHVALHQAKRWPAPEDEIADLRALADLTRHSSPRLGSNDRRSVVLRLLTDKLAETTKYAQAWRSLQDLRARALMDMGKEGPSNSPTVTEARKLLAATARPGHRPSVLVDIVVTPHGLGAYLVDTKGKVDFLDSPGDLEPLKNARLGDLPAQAAKLRRLAHEGPLLTGLAAQVHARTGTRDILLCVDDTLGNLPWGAVQVDGKPWQDSQLIGRIPAVGVLRFTPGTASGRSLVAGDSTGDLPGARRECERISDLLNARPPLVGPACTQSALGSSQDHLDFLHLAVHGYADSRRGGRATLVLAGPDGRHEWVPFENLAKLPWRARVVVFSGCSTAVGGPRHGKGLYGIAQTAMSNGADTIVATLWPVNDAATSAFMTAFHASVQEQLVEGFADLRIALRNAARDYAHQPDYPVAMGSRCSRGTRELFVRKHLGLVDSSPPHEAAVTEAFVVMGNPILRR